MKNNNQSQIVFENHQFKSDDFNSISSIYINNYPVLYILHNYKNKAYIGKTTNIRSRMKQHLKINERKVFSHSLIIGHEKFNQSATYNLETKLINHFLADGKFTLQNKSQTSKNQSIHNYFEKQFFNIGLFNELWEELRSKGLAINSSDVIQNKDVYKLSPFHELSESQLEIKNAIISYCEKNIDSNKNKVFFIEGDAGTGKSVVLSSLFNDICNLTKDNSSNFFKKSNYLLVNHSEVQKTYQTMAERLPNMKKKQILKPTTFINDFNKGKIPNVDIVLVDEAHLLLTNEDKYNGFNFENQMEEIIKRSKISIIIFDPKQVLKLKSNWDITTYSKLFKQYESEVLKLTDQFRMNASDKIINWIDSFVDKTILPLPNSTENYKFEICSSPDEIKNKIYQLNKKDKLSRLVSTFDYVHKKDGGKYYVDENGLNLPWNSVNPKKVWAENPETINEVGSIYTIQGFDLNNVGVILGPSIDYDNVTDKIVINHWEYKDKGAFTNVANLSGEELLKAKENIILNSVNILMKRGIKGLYIYAANPNLRNKLLSMKYSK
ncbi:DUF2075 domain-containing protein [Streptococcus iniae]